jgi:integrase
MMTGIQASGLSPRTAGAARGTLSAALSAAVADGLLTVNVARAARPPARPSTSPSAFTDDELDRIAVVCAQHRLGMLFLFAALTGLRTSELLGLEWEHVDLEEGRYQVVEGLHRIGATGAAAIGVEPGLLASHPKTVGSGDGTPMSPAAVDVLRRWKTAQAAERLAAPRWSDSGRVFTTATGTPLDPSNVRRQWRKVLAAAKVPAKSRGGAGRGLHELRRTFASRLRRAGVSLEEVQRLGRWSSPAMLLAHYRAVDEAHLRDAAGAGDAGVSWIANS